MTKLKAERPKSASLPIYIFWPRGQGAISLPIFLVPPTVKGEAREETMRTLFALLATMAFATGALADDSCKAQATAKSLHGAAETSFMTKCEKTAKTKCDADAKTKKLHGAAETSFTTKCVKDATGA